MTESPALDCSAPTCQPQDGFVCAQHRLVALERERDRMAGLIEDARELLDRTDIPSSEWDVRARRWVLACDTQERP